MTGRARGGGNGRPITVIMQRPRDGSSGSPKKYRLKRYRTVVVSTPSAATDRLLAEAADRLPRPCDHRSRDRLICSRHMEPQCRRSVHCGGRWLGGEVHIRSVAPTPQIKLRCVPILDIS